MALLKYPGGKETELKFILPNSPSIINNYYEPFVGGGAVFLSIIANRYFINDKSDELIGLYNAIKTRDINFFNTLKSLAYNWDLLSKIVFNNSTSFINLYKLYRDDTINDIRLSDTISEYIIDHSTEFNGMFHTDFNYYIENFIHELGTNLFRKIKNMKKLEVKKNHKLSDNDILDNIECAFKSGFYMHFRYLMNHKLQINETNGFNSAIYLFIRDTCYSSMFRYNKSGEFNVPYGGISYNKKSFFNKIKQFQDENLITKLQNTTIRCEDFSTFMDHFHLNKNDFLFIDPPYDTEFSTYAGNEFSKLDQERLANYLINDCTCNFMVIIKDTDLISSLYKKNILCKNGNTLSISSFNKQYTVSFKNRNQKSTNHLMIKNY